MPDRAIGIEKVRKVFDGNVTAIDGVDLNIPRGQFVAFLGPSGCGKSTLLRMIAGLDRPTSGQIQREAIGTVKRDISYVFQDAHLLPWRTAVGNVMLPLELAGVDRDEREWHALDMLKQVGLSDAVNQYPAQLSGGMKMRVSLARALVTTPDLLLLDEPFAALDEISRQHLDERLRELWLERHFTVVFVTHSISEAAYLADRAIVFSKRPAKVVLDHNLSQFLPRGRPAALRTESIFMQQMRLLFDSLQSAEMGGF
ncbi:MAG: ABC transporter ATP-binding protein [Burkholderiales bacterium]|nr:ABC transporter ATP-binding protein [Phycisphaerae bacterium]